MKSAYYLAGDTPGEVVATPRTAGPWTAAAQHGGPPAALLARAVEALVEPGRTVGRFTLDLLGPVPVGPLQVTSEVLRPGRTVALVGAALADSSGRVVARAQAWAMPLTADGPGDALPMAGHAPGDGRHEEPPATWHRDGYMESVEWRWVNGAVSRPGPGVVWMRPLLPLLEGEALSPLQRVLVCADSASGVSSALDADAWNFLNTELTVHLVRPAEGEWICLDAVTTLGPGAVGVAASTIYDETGLVGWTRQTLLVVPNAEGSRGR
ncbi:thioesterase family protein [Nocardioides mangrovicus]|uniref:Thioesterase family protein n=1 Tax=Nocardioides mangrovicus TaxID=2478913 RepID=A0A3L8P6H9_9ACTN|nr:thioesterase family protein [Nocardioides mangrovicus]RLV50582.1 thioesterase family protein [Nocardioides mangrovicus]